jgi:hypothetical protein
VLQRVDQLLAEGKHFIGIVKRHPAGLRQHEPAADAFEELMSKRLLQILQLCADGRLRDQQLFAGADHAALAGDHPEVVEVVVVEPFHDEGNYSLNRIYG